MSDQEKRSRPNSRPQRGGPRTTRRDHVAALALRAGLLAVPKGVTTAGQVTRMRRARGMPTAPIPVARPDSASASTSGVDERRAAARARAEAEACRILREHRSTVGFAAAQDAAAKAFAHALRRYPETWDAALAGRPIGFVRAAEAWWDLLERQAAAERAADCAPGWAS